MEKGLPFSSFNEKIGYGDRSKIFYTELANIINDLENSPFGADIKDYVSLVHNIKEKYQQYFGQHLSDLKD
ncbi:Hypothetical protein HVR_LOCUS267 [uncultured virus]|nr:Hypothetical protein HVR_LOCUS267 [uncultured virus]